MHSEYFSICFFFFFFAFVYSSFRLLLSTLSDFRLDQILGKQGSKAKDVYASKISLASRVVKVERSVMTFWSFFAHFLHKFFSKFKVADIEEKLDILIKAYMQDRERFLALPLSSEQNSHSNNQNNSGPPQPPPGSSGTFSSSNVVVTILKCFFF